MTYREPFDDWHPGMKGDDVLLRERGQPPSGDVDDKVWRKHCAYPPECWTTDPESAIVER